MMRQAVFGEEFVVIEIDEGKCIGCGACAANCVAHNIEMITYDNAEQVEDRQTSAIGESVRKAKVLHECFLCGQCEIGRAHV